MKSTDTTPPISNNKSCMKGDILSITKYNFSFTCRSLEITTKNINDFNIDIKRNKFCLVNF